MKKNGNLYLIWNETDWEQFESLEDAVSSAGDGCEVYIAEPRLLGKFKLKAEVVKIKTRKKRKARK